MIEIITQTGCYLDGQRGHYVARDVVYLAQGYGFIVGALAQWALDAYEDHHHEDAYPAETISELAGEARDWLNSGRCPCDVCAGTALAPDGADYFTRADDPTGTRCCRACSGSRRGDRVAGQNFPPVVPDGAVWDWDEGDFGLYAYDADGEIV